MAELQYDIKALQERLASMLAEVDQAFKKAGIRYFLYAGTLLGAVRHKGFVPWDDDVDIAMPRSDYEYLCQHSSEILPEHLQWISIDTDTKHQFPFAKIQDRRTTLIERKHMGYLGGVYIDVFPIDVAPNNAFVRRWHMIRVELMRRMLFLVVRDPYRHGRGPSSWMPRLLQRLYTLPQLQQKAKRLYLKYQHRQSEWVSENDYGLRACFPKSWIADYVELDFQGHKYPAPAQYDQLLRNYYGDYTQLPPPEQRLPHKFYFLDLNTPFSESRE